MSVLQPYFIYLSGTCLWWFLLGGWCRNLWPDVDALSDSILHMMQPTSIQITPNSPS